jgi:uncharacterized protein YoxC
MSIGDIAGLIAAVAFVGLVGFLAVPLVKLGGVFDEARESVRKITDHATPILDESVTTVTEANAQLAKIDSITSSVAEISANTSALTSLVAATVGGPLIKVAAFSYGVRQAVSGLFNREGGR